MAVNAEPGEDYGTLRVLQLPRNTTIPGPGQVQNNFESDPEVSRQLTLLRSGGSDVVFGNLLTLPVGGGLLYVEPVYVQAATGQSYPLLRKVLVSFADTVGFDDTLAGALNQVFQGNAGAGTQEPTTPAPGKPTPAPGTTTAQQDLTRALSDASAALAEANAALKAGDFAAYGAAQQKLADAITRATKAQAQLVQAQGGTTATASPSPSPSG